MDHFSIYNIFLQIYITQNFARNSCKSLKIPQDLFCKREEKLKKIEGMLVCCGSKSGRYQVHESALRVLAKRNIYQNKNHQRI